MSHMSYIYVFESKILLLFLIIRYFFNSLNKLLYLVLIKLWILMEDYLRITSMARFFNPTPRGFSVELGLESSQIQLINF
jgi:hypothetical protein